MGKSDYDPILTAFLLHLKGHGLTAELSAAASKALAAELVQVSLLAGEWLFQKGDHGDSLYVLDTGLLRVVDISESGEETQIDIIPTGAVVGELALLTGQARSASVQAATDSTLIRLTKSCFDQLAQSHSEIYEHIGRLAQPRIRRTQLAEVLRRFFGQLEMADLHEIEQQLAWRRVVSGDVVYRQGESGDFMVIVVNGRLRIIDQSEGESRLLDEVGRGESVGEFSLLTGEPRETTVRAVRDSDLLILSKETFEYLKEQYPQAVVVITRNLALRLKRAGGRPTREPGRSISLAIVPITESESLTEFVHSLKAEIERFGPTLLLSASTFDSSFGKEGAAHIDPENPLSIAIVGWLNEQESKHHYLIYQADCDLSEWTRRCLRQSDRIVFVAEASRPAEPGQLEQAIAESDLEARKELVLLYRDAGARPTNTAAWLAPRQLDAYHHLRLPCEADRRRVARRLTDRAMALVLSGGSARGTAHLGVYQALTELGIPVDMVGGTSMGALLAAMIAFEYDIPTLLELGKEHLNARALMDYTFPAVALCQTKRVSQLMQKIFGDVFIEDLFMPYFCVSSNLSKSMPVAHTTGPLWLAVRASIAIPGVFTPVCYEGDLLVDGGAMNNLPIDIMRQQRGVGTIAAVLASPKNEKDRNWDFGSQISGWKVLGRRFNPFAESAAVPSIAETIMRALDVNSTYLMNQNKGSADLFIEPDTSEYKNLNWEAYPHIVEIGYQAAMKALTDWQAENPALEGVLW